MNERIPQKLQGVSKTLLMTLYARAREAQRVDAMIKDDLAVALVNQIDCDFSRLRMHRHDEIALILRMRKFDRHVTRFLAQHPGAAVVHIGCGLDTRFERVDDGQVQWFDLDLPDVIDLRRQLIDCQDPRYHLLAQSVFEEAWLAVLDRSAARPIMFVAEGVLPYFEEAQVKALFIRLCRRFSGCELVCDAHTPFVRWLDNLQLASAGLKARLRWAMKTGRDPEQWHVGITLLEEWNYFEEPEPRLQAYRWVRHIPALAKSSGIYHYRLGL